jgi:hypothetical protein
LSTDPDNFAVNLGPFLLILFFMMGFGIFCLI